MILKRILEYKGLILLPCQEVDDITGNSVYMIVSFQYSIYPGLNIDDKS